MNERISICIPTYKRPQLLACALESCAIQDYEDLEIVVGDDSPDNSSTSVIEQFRARRGWIFTYLHNEPSLGQNANVDQLFRAARGDRLVLLHDDDVLLHGAITKLAAPWRKHPDLVACFGRQQIITASGEVDDLQTHLVNDEFGRTGEEGILENSLRAALLQQMPNDGYMIKTCVAQRFGYRSAADVGVHCDLDFTLRIGAANPPLSMYLLSAYISQYRRSADSISGSLASRKTEHPRSAQALYHTINKIAVPPALSLELSFLMNRFVEAMVKGFAISGDRRTALRLFMSRWYGLRRRLSVKGFYHLLMILDPRIDRFRRYQ